MYNRLMKRVQRITDMFRVGRITGTTRIFFIWPNRKLIHGIDVKGVPLVGLVMENAFALLHHVSCAPVGCYMSSGICLHGM